MMTNPRKLIALIFAVTLLYVSGVARLWANVTSVTVTPSTATAAADGTGSFNLTWSATTTAAGATVSSQEGVFYSSSGVKLGRVIKNLSGVSPAATPPHTLTYNETVMVPSSVLDAAAELGLTEIAYTRRFSDTFSSDVASVRVKIAGVPTRVRVRPSPVDGSPVSDTRVSLSWDIEVTTGARLKVMSNTSSFYTPRGVRIGAPVNTTLSRTISTRTTIAETLNIPATVVQQAIKWGWKDFRYRRTFMVGSAELEGELRVTVKGGLTGVTVTPARTSVPLNRSVSVPARYAVSGISGASGTTAISSTQGVFRTPTGITLGTVGGLSTRSAAAFTSSFSETLRVPREVVFRAHRLGFSYLVFARTFSDGLSSVEAQMILDITGGAGAGFGISRVAMRFTDGSQVRVIKQGEKLNALADITYTGSGQFNANWEIAGPTSTGAAPLYRDLRWVRQYLQGFQQEQLTSPDLPTGAPGLYLVRLRINDPAVDTASIPVLQYFVGQPAPGEALGAPRLSSLSLTSPEQGAEVGKGAAFMWQAVEGSIAYQVLIFGKPAGAPVTGLIVPGDKTQAALSGLANSYLDSGGTYQWQVNAIGPDGRLSAKSSMREFHVP